MSEDNKTKATITISLQQAMELLGARYLGHSAAPVKGEKEIDFSSVGGILVQRSPLWTEIKPEERKR